MGYVPLCNKIGDIGGVEEPAHRYPDEVEVRVNDDRESRRHKWLYINREITNRLKKDPLPSAQQITQRTVSTFTRPKAALAVLAHSRIAIGCGNALEAAP